MTTKRQRKHDRLVPMGEHQNRPCEVDGRPALFHRWVEDFPDLMRINAYATPEKQARVMGYSYSSDGFTQTVALVEYQDGTVAMVDPLHIRFLNKGG